jgi:archaellum component FlaD/FlaE
MAESTYLETIESNPDQVELTLEWATYLGDTFGTSGGLNALQYYEQLGWISHEVREQMIRYIRGLSLDEIHNKKFDEPGTLVGPLDSLSGSPFGAHSVSLQYIAAIAGHDLEANVMLARMARQRVDSRTDGRPGPFTIDDEYELS